MIKSIKLSGFRIFNNYETIINNNLVIFSGYNATGKTSILEAINYIATAKSHRTNNLDELINNNSEYFQIDLVADKSYRAIYSKNAKSFLIDGNKYNKISDFVGNLNTVMFSPIDINLVSGPKSVRRRFINQELSLLDKKYLYLLNSYNKVLKERNECLKLNKIDDKLLNILTNELITLAKRICNKRKEFINKLNESLKHLSKELNIEDISIEYNPAYLNDMIKAYNNKLSYDIFTKTTNLGPHRDDLIIKIDNNLAMSYASEGQSRMIAIIIKLALREIIEKTKGIKPIMLLDDVFASIDNKRINNLIKFIKDGYQAILTTTSTVDIPDELLKEALVIRLKK